LVEAVRATAELVDEEAVEEISEERFARATSCVKTGMQAVLAEAAREDLLRGQTPQAKARLLSARGKGATAWLRAVPLDKRTYMDSLEFLTATLTLLGQSHHILMGRERCCGGHPMRADGYHLHAQACQYTYRSRNLGNATVHRHNQMVRVCAGLVAEAGLQAEVEEHVLTLPGGRGWESGGSGGGGEPGRPRADLSVYGFPGLNGATNTALCDVTICGVLKGDGSLMPKANEPGGVALAREKTKHEKYKGVAGGVVVPLVLEQFGRRGEEMDRFLSTVARLQAARALGVPYVDAHRHQGYARAKSAADNHCTMVVSVAMAREQAQLIIRGAESAGGRSGVAARCRPAVALPPGLAAVGAGVGRVSEVGLLHAQGLPCAAF